MNEVPDSPKPEPQPSVRPTRPVSLLVIAGVLGVCGWVLVDAFYGVMPSLPWIPSALLGGLGVVEYLLGRSTKARIGRQPGADPVEPLLVARLTALAKASSLVGAGYAGFFTGIGAWLWGEAARLRVAQDDLWVAFVAVACGVILAVAALWLEHCCRIPPPSDEEDTLNDRL